MSDFFTKDIRTCNDGNKKVAHFKMNMEGAGNKSSLKETGLQLFWKLRPKTNINIVFWARK